MVDSPLLAFVLYWEYRVVVDSPLLAFVLYWELQESNFALPGHISREAEEINSLTKFLFYTTLAENEEREKRNLFLSVPPIFVKTPSIPFFYFFYYHFGSITKKLVLPLSILKILFSTEWLNDKRNFAASIYIYKGMRTKS